MVTICCSCKREKKKSGWEKPGPGRAGKLSHGFCPECHGKMLARLEEHSRRRGLQPFFSCSFSLPT
ncbi:MAG: hypothetical protein M0017_09875 [Desulfobacteraceae bacterium]|nr:hypothetical protein [Desulfobacteraceae bacterium]